MGLLGGSAGSGKVGDFRRSIDVGNVLHEPQPNVPKVKKAKVFTEQQKAAKAAEKTRLLQIRNRGGYGTEDTNLTLGYTSLLGTATP